MIVLRQGTSPALELPLSVLCCLLISWKHFAVGINIYTRTFGLNQKNILIVKRLRCVFFSKKPPILMCFRSMLFSKTKLHPFKRVKV